MVESCEDAPQRQAPLVPNRGGSVRDTTDESPGKKSYVPPIVEIDENRRDDSVHQLVSYDSRSPLSITDESHKTDKIEVENVFSSETEWTEHHLPPALRKQQVVFSNSSSFAYPQKDDMILSNSSSFASGLFRRDYVSAWAEAEYVRLKKKFAVVSICLSVAQLAVLMLQLALCGVAPFDVNPIIGPYPDAFSEWGGKNPYLIVNGMELWRLVTPAFLHVGVLHLLVNAAVQLETCAYFEREWGSIRYLLIYVVSEVGAVGLSCIVEPDAIAVGSSAALMGLFGAKLAQILMCCCFDLDEEKGNFALNPLQALGLFFMFFLISLLSVLTYIEWSAHVGGLTTGFLCGVSLLCGSVKSKLVRCTSLFLALAVFVSGFTVMMYYLFDQVEPDDELADVCQFFRRLYAEGYSCECFWH